MRRPQDNARSRRTPDHQDSAIHRFRANYRDDTDRKPSHSPVQTPHYIHDGNSPMSQRRNSRPASSSNDFNEFEPEAYESGSESPKLSHYSEYEDELESESLAESAREEEDARRWRKRNKIRNIALIIACAYLIFLIYGVFCTSFHYDTSGNVVPQVLTVSQIKDKKTFDGVMIYYNDCKLMYKEILKADYNASLTVGDKAQYTQADVSKQYSSLRETNKTINAKKLASRLHAATDDSRFADYAPVLGNMYQWVNNLVAPYLTDAAKYLTGESTQAMSNTVISLQGQLSDAFTSITQTMAGYAKGKPGVDIAQLQWNPTEYYKQLEQGKVGSKD